MCEDAPCCGCCGPEYGVDDYWHDVSDDYDDFDVCEDEDCEGCNAEVCPAFGDADDVREDFGWDGGMEA